MLDTNNKITLDGAWLVCRAAHQTQNRIAEPGRGTGQCLQSLSCHTFSEPTNPIGLLQHHFSMQFALREFRRNNSQVWVV